MNLAFWRHFNASKHIPRTVIYYKRYVLLFQKILQRTKDGSDSPNKNKREQSRQGI